MKKTAIICLLAVAALLLCACGSAGRTAPIRFPDNPDGSLTALGLSEDFACVLTEEYPNASSLAQYQGDWFLIAQYRRLALIDMTTGAQRTIEPENLSDCEVIGDLDKSLSPYEDAWNPTGLYYDAREELLYIANYHGHNVLIGRITENDTFFAEKMIVAEGMVAPEGIAVNEKRSRIAVADCDGNTLFLFDRHGELLWQRSVEQTHGVAISRDTVYCTSLTTREVIRFDYKGNELGRVGHMANSGPEGYMWPISLALSGDQLLVADAHTGRLTVLDRELRYQCALGCNGPYATNFNYPYAVIVVGDMIYIADTFSYRIVQLDKQGTVCSQVSLEPPLTQDEGEELYIPAYPFDSAYLYDWQNDVPASFLCSLYGEDARVLSGYGSVWAVLGDSYMRQSNMMTYSSGVKWFDDHTASEMYSIWTDEEITDRHRYYLFGSLQSDALLFFSTDTAFGGIIWTNHEIMLPDSEGGVIGDAALFRDYLQILDDMTDAFCKYTGQGMTRYQACCKALMDHYKMRYSGQAPAMNELEAWIEYQCTRTAEAEELYRKAVLGEAGEAEYKQYTTDSYCRDSNGNPVLAEIFLRTFCGAEEHPATVIALTGGSEGFIDGYRLDNALDRNPEDDYSAMEEGTEPSFSLYPASGEESAPIAMLIEWESGDNYARAYTAALLRNGETEYRFDVDGQNSAKQWISLDTPEELRFDEIRITVRQFVGQPRVLLRQVTAWRAAPEAASRPTTEEAAEICREVHSWIRYGVGPIPAEPRMPTEQEILDYGEGHCGMYAYLFIKELSRRGTTAAAAYDIESRYLSDATANHTVVEVETTDGPRVFDPTYGGYYLADIQTLFGSENAMAYAVDLEVAEAYYLTDRFWNEASSYEVVRDIRNRYDRELTGAGAVCMTGMDSQAANVTQDERLGSGEIRLRFAEAAPFYRVECSFREKLPDPLTALITVERPDGTVESCPLRMRKDSEYSVEIQLDSPVETQAASLVFDTEELPPLCFFAVYQ